MIDSQYGGGFALINVSELGRKSPDYPLWEKVRYFRDPDIYLVENIGDFLANAPRIIVPWYKKPFPVNLFASEQRAYIILQNVGIKTVEAELGIKGIGSQYFVVHDASGIIVMYWGSESEPYFASLQSYESAQEQQGLKEEDWAYDVFVRYSIKLNFPSIIQVRKYRFSNRKPEKVSLAEWIKDFFPGYIPIPNQA